MIAAAILITFAWGALSLALISWRAGGARNHHGRNDHYAQEERERRRLAKTQARARAARDHEEIVRLRQAAEKPPG